jgi:hypothetical protein
MQTRDLKKTVAVLNLIPNCYLIMSSEKNDVE